MTPSTGDEAEAEPVIGYVFFTSLQLQQDLGGLPVGRHICEIKSTHLWSAL